MKLSESLLFQGGGAIRLPMLSRDHAPSSSSLLYSSLGCQLDVKNAYTLSALQAYLIKHVLQT